jgi:hypothetical protein
VVGELSVCSPLGDDRKRASTEGRTGKGIARSLPTKWLTIRLHIAEIPIQRPSKQHKLIGEATPIYMYWKEAPERIREYNAKMKLIILLRNPIDRAYSHWNMERSRKLETLPFFDAVKTRRRKVQAGLFHFNIESFHTQTADSISKQLQSDLGDEILAEPITAVPAERLFKSTYFLLEQ